MNTFTRKILPTIAAGCVVLCANGVFGASLTAARLHCENGVDPLGIDVQRPQLSWIVESAENGERQTAYQILASSNLLKLAADQGDQWDSGKVDSSATGQILYAGRALASSQQVFWKVRAWDKGGQPGPWSKPANWTMGLLSDADWQGAQWIGAANAANPPDAGTTLLRREFDVKPGLRRAVMHICGLGQYETTLANNGLLSPGWTDYRKTCLYDTLDITGPLLPGKRNAVGVFLGNGMYNVVGVKDRYTKFKGTFGPRKAIALIRLEYEDGSVEFVKTDGEWRTAPGPVTFSSIYGGEDHDARLEPRGWSKPEFDQSKWAAAAPVDGPGGTLRGFSCAAPPIRAFDEIASQDVAGKMLRPGVTVYDLGQNVSAVPLLHIVGAAGSSVRVIPAELLRPDGSVDRGSSGGGNAYWQYTLAQEPDVHFSKHPPVQAWQPSFFYHGCRYLQVECRPATDGGELPSVRGIKGLAVHSDAEPIGEFSCSNDLFNRIFTLVRWAQRSNMMSVLTDCPHREKLGWLEQTHLNGPALRYNFDLTRLFAKVTNDMADAQRPDGLVPDIAPEYTVFKGGFLDSPEWGSAFLLVPWQQYEFTGDSSLLARYYDGMKRYVDYLTSRAQDGVVSHGLGDWYDIGPKKPGVAQLTPVPLTATAFYFQDADILAKTAKLLGKADDAARYGQLAGEIKDAFNKKFWDAEKRYYSTGSQTANALPLVMKLADTSAQREGALKAIIKDVQERGNAITAGDVGYRYLLRALADNGRSDVIFDMNNQSDKPGYGYQLAHGATSLTEAWDASRGSSQNHFMLGQIVEWFYHDLAGIGYPGEPGSTAILLKPQPIDGLTWVKASHRAAQGLIVSDWRHENGRFTWHVTLPANSSAAVYLPTSKQESVRISGKDGVPINPVGNEAVGLAAQGGYDWQGHMSPVYNVSGGGTYTFEADL